MPLRMNERVFSGVSTRLAAPTTAASTSPARRCNAAWCRATSEDEQAVSTVKLGPDQPKA